MDIKLIVSDLDGVWTDGSFYYSRGGDSLRRFTTKDSFGVRLCQLLEIPLLILSTEENIMVRKRMEKLKIGNVKLGVVNKLSSLSDFCKNNKIKMQEVAYLGDDMNDFHLLGQVGFFGCPADAYPVIKEHASLILKTRGGEGAFREFVETILKESGRLKEGYDLYLKTCLEKQV